MAEDGRTAVVVVADMLFASRVRGAAAVVGLRTVVRPGCEGLVRTVKEADASLVVVDLEVRRGGAADAIRELRADPATREVEVVAFSSHTNVEAIGAGREAGADRVLARSGFVQELPHLLESVASKRRRP